MLGVTMARHRRDIDRALLHARRGTATYKEIAFEVIAALEGEQTADELERVVEALRTRTKVALRRVSTASDRVVAVPASPGQDGGKEATNMEPQYPYRRRVIEEWYETPGACPAPFDDEAPPLDNGLHGSRDLGCPTADHDDE